jgi:hypothetical protein
MSGAGLAALSVSSSSQWNRNEMESSFSLVPSKVGQALRRFGITREISRVEKD